MPKINFSAPTKLEDIIFNIALNRQSSPLPQEIQKRVDTKFEDFSDKAEAKFGKRPTKGEICVLTDYNIIPKGLEGVCRIATFDKVLYFARSQIPEEDYEVGRTQVGFPLASWGVLSSKDNQLLFLRKKGSEGAYEGSPYSAFGGLVSSEKDVEDERISPAKLLERSVGGEVDKAIWERRLVVKYFGLNIYDENSSKVNNGYDSVWEVSIDAEMDNIMTSLEDNTQFESKAKASPIVANPNSLREFVVNNQTTISGLSGVFSYISANFGNDELLSQYARYKKERSEAVDLEICPVE